MIHIAQNKPDIEEILVVKCQAGSNSAQKDLYIKYSKRLLSVCFRYCGDVDMAHDLLHDGFIKIFTMIERFEWRGEGSLELWMRRVVANVCLDYLQSQKKRNEVELLEDAGTMSEAFVEPIEDEEQADNISQEQLLKFIAELPEGYRTVFNLFVFEKKTHKEIAAALGINEHSSTSQLHRAKCILAKRINDFIKNEAKK